MAEVTCRTCKDTGQIVREDREHYATDPETGGQRLVVGPVVDACPVCAAEAEAEWWALTMPRVAAE